MATGDLTLGQLALDGSDFRLPISEERYQQLRDALNGLEKTYAFEDKLAMLVENYVEYELALLTVSAQDTVGLHRTIDDFLQKKRGINRHLSNLLAMGRQYRDQNKKHIEPLLEGTGTSFTASIATSKKNNLAHRVVEALRNYVQHYDLGVHVLTIGGAWIDDNHGQVRRHYTSATLDLDHLERDGEFDKDLIRELRNEPSVPDITLLIRQYISEIAAVHKKVRVALESKADGWRLAIQSALDDYKSVAPSTNLIGVCVFREDSGSFARMLDVDLGIADRLRLIQDQNPCPLNLGPACTSSEIVKQKWKKGNRPWTSVS
jgi:hypothetical protein